MDGLPSRAVSPATDQVLAALAGGLIGAFGSFVAVTSQVRHEAWRDYMARNSEARGAAISALTSAVLRIQELRAASNPVTSMVLDHARAAILVARLVTSAAPHAPWFHGHQWHAPTVAHLDTLASDVERLGDGITDTDLVSLSMESKRMIAILEGRK